MAIIVGDGPVTLTVSVPITALAVVTLILRGFGEHITPGGSVGHVTATVPVNPLLGVTVIVEVAELPAVTGVGENADALIVKDGLGLTVNITAGVEVPPPGAGFATVTNIGPTVAISVARIDAVTCVALTNVVVLAVPLKFTTELLTKLVPFTVSENAAPPAVALGGMSVVTVGTGSFTVKFTAGVEVPPPGAGFVTVTGFVPAVAMSAARIDAVTCVALTNVVVLAVPLKFTAEVLTKFVPVTISVNAAPPAVPLVGLINATVGTRLFTAKFTEPEVPPPEGFVTVTPTFAAVAISGAVMAAVTCVAFTKVVVGVLAPKLTVEPLTKFVPFTVSVNAAPPAVALVGMSVVMVGVLLAAVTVTETAVDGPDPE